VPGTSLTSIKAPPPPPVASARQENLPVEDDQLRVWVSEEQSERRPEADGSQKAEAEANWAEIVPFTSKSPEISKSLAAEM